MPTTNLPESINKEIIKAQTQTAKQAQEGSSARGSLDILKRQREILASGHLGPKIGIGGTGRKAGSTLSKEGRTARAEYERLGKALIQASTNIPIRNRQEFEVLAQDLYDTNRTQEEIAGTLNALERIIKSSLGEEADFINQGAQATEQSQNQFVKMRDPSGVIRNIPANQAQSVQSAGGTLVQ